MACATERLNATPRNIEWRELLKGQRPFMLPRIYSDWIGGFLDVNDLEKLKSSGKNSKSPSRDAKKLVLLTRHRADLPQIFTHQQRVYLQPTQKVAAINMDCTSGENVQITYAQGRSEALALMG